MDLKDTNNPSLTIQIGSHSDHGPSVCNSGTDLDVNAYHSQTGGSRRGYQHWDACQDGNDITIYLLDHPALVCAVGPNTHYLDLNIEGLNERIIIKESGCQ